MKGPSLFRRRYPSQLLGWCLAALCSIVMPTVASAHINFADSPAGASAAPTDAYCMAFAGASASFALARRSMQKKKKPASGSQTRRSRHGTNRRYRTPAAPRPAFRAQGVLVEHVNGQVVLAESQNDGFNPASTLKLATTLYALRRFGPRYEFVTQIWISGDLDVESGVLNGNLYLDGRDLSMRESDVRLMASQLQKAGIRSVQGKIFVTPTFTVNFAGASSSAAQVKQLFLQEKLHVAGGTGVGAVPVRATLSVSHSSAPLVEILKVMLCYSSNYMAERLGSMIGGPAQMERLLIAEGVPPEDLKLASASGLGVNRVTPTAMMLVLRALVAELEKNRLSLTDILPVAGVDPGTLFRRYGLSPGRGSIAAKTGTLKQTDRGASALVGEASTANGGTVYFVIFHRLGNVPAMRARQDQIIAQVQSQLGGPSLLNYLPEPLLFSLGHS